MKRETLTEAQSERPWSRPIVLETTSPATRIEMTPARLRYSQKLLSGPTVLGLIGCDKTAADRMVRAGIWGATEHKWAPGRWTKAYHLTPAGRQALADREAQDA
jgi:hypothetical protein